MKHCDVIWYLTYHLPVDVAVNNQVPRSDYSSNFYELGVIAQPSYYAYFTIL